MPWKNPFDFGGNRGALYVRVRVGLGLRLTLHHGTPINVPWFHVKPGRTVLRLAECRVTPRYTGYDLFGAYVTVIKGDLGLGGGMRSTEFPSC